VQTRAAAHGVSFLALAASSLALVACAFAPSPRVPTPPPAPTASLAPPAPAPQVAAKSEPVSRATALRLGWPIWLGIVCDDLEAQRHFYREVLGLRERDVRAGSSWFELDGKLLELFAKSERPQYARRGVAFGFVVEDIESARSTLLQRGVIAVSEIEGGSGDRWAYFKDADGNLFELVERAR
jgi:catechol 2,3-dioxygenase-like lactoylglutathione lyase family enzyme